MHLIRLLTLDTTFHQLLNNRICTYGSFLRRKKWFDPRTCHMMGVEIEFLSAWGEILLHFEIKLI